MSARQNDDLRIVEIFEVIQETRSRLNELGMDRDAFIHPSSAVVRNAVDGIHSCVFRVAEEASNLDYSTMSMFPTIPWDAVRGMRNRLAHDYRGVDSAFVWDTAHDDFDALEQVCLEYCDAKGIALRDRVDLTDHSAQQ